MIKIDTIRLGSDKRGRSIYNVTIYLENGLTENSSVEIINPEANEGGFSRDIRSFTIKRIGVSQSKPVIGFEWRVKQIIRTGNNPSVKGLFFVPALGRNRLGQLSYQLFESNYTGDWYVKKVDKLFTPQSPENNQILNFYRLNQSGLFSGTTGALFSVRKSGLSPYVLYILGRFISLWPDIYKSLGIRGVNIPPTGVKDLNTLVMSEVYTTTEDNSNLFVPYKVKYIATYNNNARLEFIWDVMKDVWMNSTIAYNNTKRRFDINENLKWPVLSLNTSDAYYKTYRIKQPEIHTQPDVIDLNAKSNLNTIPVLSTPSEDQRYFQAYGTGNDADSVVVF